jgi:hypothetical protein
VKRRPHSPRYRNLTARGGVVYYERLVGGRRRRFSCHTDDWDTAVAVRDLYEERMGIGKVPFYTGEVPRFREFAVRYLDEDTSHLAPTTRSDRRGHLRDEGP